MNPSPSPDPSHPKVTLRLFAAPLAVSWSSPPPFAERPGGHGDSFPPVRGFLRIGTGPAGSMAMAAAIRSSSFPA
jgi:hypothetical protein